MTFPVWSVIAVWPAAAALVAASAAVRAACRHLTGKRRDAHADRAIRIASPGHPEDTELEDWEREEVERMETYYAADGMDPHGKRRTTGGLS